MTSRSFPGLARSLAVAAAFLVTGCGAIKTSAIKSVADTLSQGGTTFTSHNDPELIEGALPFALTLYESLLDSIPKHEPLLTATCAAYTQYAYGFVQVHAEETQFDDYERSRALHRARAEPEPARTRLLLARPRGAFQERRRRS